MEAGSQACSSCASYHWAYRDQWVMLVTIGSGTNGDTGHHWVRDQWMTLVTIGSWSCLAHNGGRLQPQPGMKAAELSTTGPTGPTGDAGHHWVGLCPKPRRWTWFGVCPRVEARRVSPTIDEMAYTSTGALLSGTPLDSQKNSFGLTLSTYPFNGIVGVSTVSDDDTWINRKSTFLVKSGSFDDSQPSQMHLYGIFTSPSFGPVGSAVCVFNYATMANVFHTSSFVVRDTTHHSRL
ncbi:hypothetical protein EMCRGX_G008541 [Ephydatia muelleri]